MLPSLLECHENAVNGLLKALCVDEEERTDYLVCLLKEAESELTTCQFPGETYLLALRYRSLALLELRRLMSYWQSGLSAALINGKQPNYRAPSICDTEHGQLLEQLQRRTSMPVIMGM